MKRIILKIINGILKIFHAKLIRFVDESSNAYRLNLALKEYNIEYVFDIGANEGQFAQELRHYGFKNKIISFEPLIDEHKKLVLNSSKDSNWEVYKRIAVGNKNSKNIINVSKNSVSSSILNINLEHIDSAPNSKVVGQQDVEEKKLDDIFYELDIKEPNLFLKIDAQGYESQVLEGAENVIKRFKGILVEVSLTELYENQKTWLHIIKKIESLGYECWSVDRGFTNKNTGRSLQADLVFFQVGVSL